MIRYAAVWPVTDSCETGPAGLTTFIQKTTRMTTQSTQTPAQAELATLLVDTLNLEEVNAADIDPAQPLFGEGLGLDSIDALELALAISKQYGFQLRSHNDDNRRIFGSLAALSEHIEQNRAS